MADRADIIKMAAGRSGYIHRDKADADASIAALNATMLRKSLPPLTPEEAAGVSGNYEAGGGKAFWSTWAKDHPRGESTGAPRAPRATAVAVPDLSGFKAGDFLPVGVATNLVAYSQNRASGVAAIDAKIAALQAQREAAVKAAGSAAELHGIAVKILDQAAYSAAAERCGDKLSPARAAAHSELVKQAQKLLTPPAEAE